MVLAEGTAYIEEQKVIATFGSGSSRVPVESAAQRDVSGKPLEAIDTGLI